jgi:hypothetical protein
MGNGIPEEVTISRLSQVLTRHIVPHVLDKDGDLTWTVHAYPGDPAGLTGWLACDGQVLSISGRLDVTYDPECLVRVPSAICDWQRSHCWPTGTVQVWETGAGDVLAVFGAVHQLVVAGATDTQLDEWIVTGFCAIHEYAVALHRALNSCPVGPVPSAPELESWLHDEED